MKNMKKLLFSAILLLSLTGCNKNQLEQTQWEGINGCEISILSLDVDTCCIYGTSPSTGKTFSIGMRYDFNNNILSFSPLSINFGSQPTYKLDGDFLIDTKTNIPTFKKIK